MVTSDPSRQRNSTPSNRSLAAGGAKFTQFYVQPMCTPTRAALMPGRYPFRYGLQVGRVVAALDKKKMRENTLILFHSDNGGTRSAKFAGVMADMSKVTLPCDNGPYREGKGTLYEGATRVCALANWPGHIKAQTVNGLIHAVDIYPTLAALAGASTAKCKPLDGVNVWDTIAQGTPSPRSEIVYNVEPFRAAIRQGDWKLVWRTVLPSSVELFNLAQDPSEQHDLAAANPEKVAVFQQRLNALAKESAKPLFLVDQFKVIKNMKGELILPTDEEYAEVEAP